MYYILIIVINTLGAYSMAHSVSKAYYANTLSVRDE